MGKRAILVVSFGTSYPETRKKTIDQIEREIAERYPDFPVYRAWTSKVICRKLLRRDSIKICGISETMVQMEADGITEVVVQPTHVINGIETERMTEAVMQHRSRFSKLVIGTPLLTSQEDQTDVLQAMKEAFPLRADEMLVLLGHGTQHYANSIYAALNFRLADDGFDRMILGTVEAYPDFDCVLRRVRQKNVHRILLAPFMIVAGDHAIHDLAGADADSWKSRFEASGYEVNCILKGLGEYPAVWKILIGHVEDAMTRLERIDTEQGV